MEVAAKIAVTELSKSEFESTMMCIADSQTKAAYDQAYRDILGCDYQRIRLCLQNCSNIIS